MTPTCSALPLGWTPTTVGELIASGVDQGGPTGDSQFLYIDISAIDNSLKRITESRWLPVSDAPTRARQRVRIGDVLVSMTRPNLNAVGIVGTEHQAAVASTGLHVLRPCDGVKPRWLFYLVQTTDFVRAMSGLVLGVLYPAVRPKDIRSYPVLLPPTPEQDRIVAEIETQFTRLDAAVAALKRVQANLKRYRASVLKAACEGRLVPTEAKLARREARSYESGEELLVRIGPNSNRGVKPESGPHTTLPDGWTWTCLGQLKEFSLYGPRFSSDDYAETGVFVLRTSDISEGGKVDISAAPRMRLSAKDLQRYRLKRGDLLMTRTGSLGTLAVFDDEVEAIAGAYLIQYRLHTPAETVKFAYCCLKSPAGLTRLVRGGAGVGRPNLNEPTISAIPLPLPPLAEQRRILDEVERRASVIDEVDVEVEKCMQRAGNLRQEILARAFQGRVVPQNQSDEPAKLLLERIRADRQVTAGMDTVRQRKVRRARELTGDQRRSGQE